MMKQLSFMILVCWFLFSCKKKQENQNKPVQIAFLADVHFQDIYPEFSDTNYKGIKHPLTGNFANIRTMQSQLKSTRIYNENYFAFLSALNDISKRGVKTVVLPGDFSDDGQPIHVKGLRKILEGFTKKYGIQFFATTGNHDPVRPFTKDGIKKDFLGLGGKKQIIASSESSLIAIKEAELKPIITSEIKNWGYQDILKEMSRFGFYPQREYLYWETPFSSYVYDDYTFDKAQKDAVFEQRNYPVADQFLPDASYLVEPVAGVWLLAIDANVYLPKTKKGVLNARSDDYSGASIGYNNVLSHKNHLIDWVAEVSKKAKEYGKSLIAFSHYPMVDFNDDASSEMSLLFGSDKMQLHRVPHEEVAEAFAEAGIQIHFGGHMHINDTGVRSSKKGPTLFNIQTPSLAAYVPAYKLLTIHADFDFEVETIIIDTVKNFNELFPFYEQEYAHLERVNSPQIWDKEILETQNYKAFTKWHLKELIRLRLIPKDWPKKFVETFLKLSGKDLLLMNQDAIKSLESQLKQKKLSLKDFENWTGFDMVFDFYRLRSADELVKNEMGLKRLKQYDLVCNELKKSSHPQFVLWAKIFDKTVNGQPSNHFKINLKQNTIHRFSNKKEQPTTK